MTRVACIDIGTVTCRLAVADIEDGKIARIHKRSTIVDVGEGLAQTGVISAAAIERTVSCVDSYLAEAREMGAVVICCTMTSASRDAANSSELLDQFAERGLVAQVIPGDIEGRLTLLGVCLDFPGQLVLIADNGGGSTELALGMLGEDGLDVRAIRSVDVGCRRVTDHFLLRNDPPSADDVAEAHAFAHEPFAQTVEELGLREGGAERLVVTGGTVTSLVAIDAKLEPYDSSYVHLHELDQETVERIEDQLAQLTVAERAELPGLQAKRARVILGGAIAVNEVMRTCGFDRITVGESDLLFGLALTVAAVHEGRPSPVGWKPELTHLT